MHSVRTRPCSSLFALALVVAAGCYGSNSAVKLHGAVTLDDQPIADGRIRLVNKSSGAAANAAVADGAYEFSGAAAVTPGDYRVEIEAYRAAQRRARPSAYMGGGAAATEQYLPPRYNEVSEISVTVASGGSQQEDFVLSSSPQ